ncbi:respiratory nitrate reductase subunit gamma [Streptomyces sp. NBC_00536]|uniref:respiratory nitrate reductase subunit gamma n=1 Tax=Streptomyces sp. NBC_00536 TaxID=2975769 RepID=UPI002E807412|nr:respiratory nitrate reductase subunit gamma [Streptomyces sp. NBC_00536]WUC81146.1 respiratory nitrate reductase subunit gamma [Streptomyces sp. NBC_00536]
MDLLLWGVLPYVSAALLIAGTVWRARFDTFGWTTHSSQLHESRLLRIGSPLFHFGMLFVVMGHVVGLLIPKGWTDAVGLSDHAYHLLAISTGTVAGIAAAAGIGVLVYRRFTVPAVRKATLRSDHLMYAFLLGAMVLGLTATLLNSTGMTGDYNYRTGISVWFRSLFAFQPDYHLMAGAPLAFRLHILFGFTLFALIPYSRLVHMFSVPLKYLFRPYVVYRKRDPEQLANRATKRGWERVS